MKAMVVYESMFGDGQQIARAIAVGLGQSGVEAVAVEVGVAPLDVPGNLDLLVVGSPNHGWSMPRASTRLDAATKVNVPIVSQGIGVREWLAGTALPTGIRTAAYDTRSSHPKAVIVFDHASRSIDKALVGLGGARLAEPEHFLVADVAGPLEPGEADRAHAWGVTLGHDLVAIG